MYFADELVSKNEVVMRHGLMAVIFFAKICCVRKAERRSKEEERDAHRCVGRSRTVP